MISTSTLMKPETEISYWDRISNENQPYKSLDQNLWKRMTKLVQKCSKKVGQSVFTTVNGYQMTHVKKKVRFKITWEYEIPIPLSLYRVFSCLPHFLKWSASYNVLCSLLFGKKAQNFINKSTNKLSAAGIVEELFEEGSAMLAESYIFSGHCLTLLGYATSMVMNFSIMKWFIEQIFCCTKY